MVRWKMDQREQRNRWKEGGKDGREEIGWEELSKEIGKEEWKGELKNDEFSVRSVLSQNVQKKVRASLSVSQSLLSLVR